MIFSFFSKAKPINYAVLVALLLLFYIVTLFLYPIQGLAYSQLPTRVLSFAVLGATLIITNQMVHAAKIESRNTYLPLFFLLLLVAFPGTLTDNRIIFANFLLLLALRRLLAMASLKYAKHKVFDASFLIGIASLFCNWTLIFVILVFWSIKSHHTKHLKTWLVPFAGIMSAFIMAFAALKLCDALSFSGKHHQFSIEALPTVTLVQQVSPKVVGYAIFVLILAATVLMKARNISRKTLVLLRMAFFAFMLSIVGVLTATTDVSSAILFTFFPAAVFMSHTLEVFKKQRLKTAALSTCLITSLLLFALQFWQ